MSVFPLIRLYKYCSKSKLIKKMGVSTDLGGESLLSTILEQHGVTYLWTEVVDICACVEAEACPGSEPLPSLPTAKK